MFFFLVRKNHPGKYGFLRNGKLCDGGVEQPMKRGVLHLVL